MVQTRHQRKTINTAKSNDECVLLDKRYEMCNDPVSTTAPKIQVKSPMYKRFVNKLVKQCRPYTGKRVFVVGLNNEMRFICPDYQWKIGSKMYSLSITENGYIYVHLLSNFIDDTNDCVYNGDHITIAPTGDSYIHFHVTRIQVVMYKKKAIYADSKSTSFCTLPLKDMKATITSKKMQASQKQEWFRSQVCSNEKFESYNKSLFDMLHKDPDMTSVIFHIFSVCM